MNKAPENTAELLTAGDGGPGTVRAGGWAVEAAGLTVILGRVPVLRGIDLRVAPGESVAVMGPNGAGKTTLLGCVAGSLAPSRGTLRWFGDAAGRSPAVRRQIGLVGHQCGLYSELTALENLVFFGRMYGVRRAAERARDLLAGCGLAARADDPVGRLSRGLQQRVAIARALMHDPPLLVFDEPFANLDTAGCRWLEGLFGEWRRAGRTICFATHDSTQAEALSDRIVGLSAGRLAADRPTTQSSLHLRSA